MSWKTEIQLVDLGNDQKLEVTCTTCGHSRYENIHLLAHKQGMAFDYFDEVERQLICYNGKCPGPVRIALSSHGDTEGFVGGLA